MKRLYLAIKKRKQKEPGNTISVHERERNETSLNFLLKIKGAYNKWSSFNVDFTDSSLRITYRINDRVNHVIV